MMTEKEAKALAESLAEKLNSILVSSPTCEKSAERTQAWCAQYARKRIEEEKREAASAYAVTLSNNGREQCLAFAEEIADVAYYIAMLAKHGKAKKWDAVIVGGVETMLRHAMMWSLSCGNRHGFVFDPESDATIESIANIAVAKYTTRFVRNKRMKNTRQEREAIARVLGM